MFQLKIFPSIGCCFLEKNVKEKSAFLAEKLRRIMSYRDVGGSLFGKNYNNSFNKMIILSIIMLLTLMIIKHNSEIDNYY